VTIRTKAFAALWLLNALAAIAIALAVFSYRESTTLQDGQERLSNIIHVHGTVWRALVEMKDDQLSHMLSTSTRSSDNARQAHDAYLRAITRLVTLVRDPDQKDRLAKIQSVAGSSIALSRAAPPSRPLSEAEIATFIRNSDDMFATATELLAAFERRELELYDLSVARTKAHRFNTSSGIAAAGGVGIIVISLLILTTKRSLFDPMTRLTDSAQRIGQGDFSAAHQTLRPDEIGVLFNSFAQMAQNVKTREQE